MPYTPRVTSKRTAYKSPFLNEKVVSKKSNNEDNRLNKKDQDGCTTDTGIGSPRNVKTPKTKKLNETTTGKSSTHKEPKIYTAASVLGKKKSSPYKQQLSTAKENKPVRGSPKLVSKTPDKSPVKRLSVTPSNYLRSKTPKKSGDVSASVNVSLPVSKGKKSAKKNCAQSVTSTLKMPEAVETVASPGLQQIPKNVVRSLVHNYEDDNTTRRTARKSLYQSFSQKRKSIQYKRKSGINSTLTELSQIDFSVTVAVRVRPFNQRESDNKQVVFMTNQTVTVSDGLQNEHKFDYDYSFCSLDKKEDNFASQKYVYDKLAKPLLTAAFEGYNTCLFAYGQTGSGKSYTVMGYDEDTGIIPRFCDELFSTVNKCSRREPNVTYHVEMSYYEIYKEKIHDLLVSNVNSAEGDVEVKKQALRVREHPEDGPYVENLSTFVVRSFADIQVWLKVGNRQRATASTGMNDKSSRSHSVFVINMVRTCTDVLEGEEHKSSRRSRINLVDLAGSERSSTAQTSGQRLKEAACINKSLLTLGKVICALSEKSLSHKKQVFIPYRDSVLTWLLKDSLGGNARTAMIATVSPADCNIEETLSTLRYAAQARTIVNVVKINEDPNSKIIRELKAEIEKLRTKNAQINMDEYKATLSEVASLRDKLTGAEKERGEVEQKWKQKLEVSEKRKAQEINELKRAGVSFKVDNCLPNLVNLNEDPQLSEMLLYVIKQGVTMVGKHGNTCCDIQLSGALVADVHCKIFNENENVTLTPVDHTNYKTYINGDLVSKSTILHHGDRVIIGGDHFFRLNHPIEVQRMGKRKSKENKDFEFAKKEWIAAQTARMEQEIQNAKKDVENQYKQTINALMERDKVATHELEVIQEEKLVLECEVSANRKRRDMEKKLLMEAKPLLEDSFSNDPLLLLVQSEKQKIQEDIEKLQRNMLNYKQESYEMNDGQNSELLKLTTMINEVNNISREMKQNTEFSMYDVGKNSEIKVTNLKLKIWTLWSQNKFAEKLELIREGYDEIVSGKQEVSQTFSNLFYDVSDTWNEILESQPTSGSNMVTTPKHTRRSIRRISSLLVNRSTPALPKPITKTESDNFVMELCRNMIQDDLEKAKQFDTAYDSLLDSVNNLYYNANMLLNLYNFNESKSAAGDFQAKDMKQVSFKIFTNIKDLQAGVRVFYLEKKQARVKTCKNVLQATKQLQDEVKEMSYSVAKMFNGFENDLQPVVEESITELKKRINNFTKCLGAIAISVKSTVNFISDQSMFSKIKEAFMQGCTAYLRKTITNKIHKLDDAVAKSNQNPVASKIFTSTSHLLSEVLRFQEHTKSQDVQEILNRTFCMSDSLTENDIGLPLEEYYYNSYSYKCETLKATSSLVSDIFTIKSANMTPRDMYEIVESTQKMVVHIVELCGSHESFCNDLHETLKKSTNIQSDSANESDIISDSIQSSGLSLCECLDKLLDDLDTQSVTSIFTPTLSMSSSDMINNNKVNQSIATGTTNAISSTVFKWMGISDRGSVGK